MSANSWAAESATVPIRLSHEIAEQLDLTKTVISDPPIASDGTTDRFSHADSFDSLLAALDADDEEGQPVEKDVPTVGGSYKVPEELLHINPINGLTDIEVGQRRGDFGFNQMKEEKRSHVKHFIWFFVGPIQFVMEVITCTDRSKKASTTDPTLIRQRVSWRLF